MTDVLVIGAGIAGLACASALRAAGRSVVVVDKGRGVGGRCATRRVDGQPVDHGLCFLHGTDPDFVAAIDAVDAPRVVGWPRRVRGSGLPCHPAAFDPAARRVAFEPGVNAFAKHLAQGLDVRTSLRVAALEFSAGGVSASLEPQAPGAAPVPPIAARSVVLALPPEQAVALLAAARVEAAASSAARVLDGARALLGTVATHPCWTVIARYAGPDGPLDAEVFYPESGALQLVVHDSSKRADVPERVRTLVLQARPSWSARNLDLGADAVAAVLLAEAAAVLGPWAAAPLVAIPHRWRYARMDRGTGFAAPFLVALPGGVRIGIAGEAFDPVGGAEAAFRSGQRLARRIAAGGIDG